jgi:hypothetical protein
MPELTQHEQVAAKISDLEKMILASHPQMPLLLREIRNVLKENPAVVTLLDEDNIRIIVNGLEKQTNTYLAASMTKTSAGKTKALKSVTSNDLGFD